MALTVKDLRDRVAAQLEGVLGASGWRQSAYPVELMPYDARPDQHQAWAVAVTTTTPGTDRQSVRGTETRGTIAESTVVVGWAWWLRADDIPGDTGLAYDGEAALVAALLAVDGDPHLRLRLVQLSRRVAGGEGGALLLGTVTVGCLHRLPLA